MCSRYKQNNQPNSFLVYDLQSIRFLSYTACEPHYSGNRASQIVHQVKTECIDPSATQEPTSSAEVLHTPTAIVLQEVSSPAHMPQPAGDAPSPLTCLSFFACQRLRFWLCTCLHLLVSAWSKSVMSAQGARGKEETRVAAIRMGKILKWAVLCCSLPPSLPTARCPWSCGWKEMRLLQFIHTAHRAALPLFLFAWNYWSLWQMEKGRNREGEREEMMVREDRLFPG